MHHISISHDIGKHDGNKLMVGGHLDQLILKDSNLLKGEVFKWAEGLNGRTAEGAERLNGRKSGRGKE